MGVESHGHRKAVCTFTYATSLFILVLCCSWRGVGAYRVLEPGEITPQAQYFRPYDQGFVGRYGDPSNLQRERVNEGAMQTSAQELLYEGVSPRQQCPGMVGPFSDGNFYCTAKEFGYCDRRSGACFCNAGYAGLDCSECHGSHYKIGTLCIPKTLCQEDCSGAGDCNFYDGTCTCQEHRAGDYCQLQLCSTFSSLCETCTAEGCLRCKAGYYLNGEASVCGSCYDFDPRCAGCTRESGCTLCADPLLTSVRRSGYRASDPRLPLEEDTRELSLTLPFGTKSVDAFAEAEHYLVAPGYSATDGNRLGEQAQSCIQGLSNDASWICSPVAASHAVCGHKGVFKFGFPNYVVSENIPSVRLSVSRSGGGYGSVSVSYYINHITTNDSDVSATAIYTTSQKLVFEEGVVERSFLINIQDDNLVEDDEVFQVVLEVPEGGGSVGPQFRTNVTIIDDDAQIFSSTLSYPIQNTTHIRAMQPYNLIIQAADAKNKPMDLGGERIVCVIENDLATWENPGTKSASQRHTLRRVIGVTDLGDGTYKMEDTVGLKEQGSYQLRAWHAFPGGLSGQYYYDGFFDNLALMRQDRVVNFTWGYGKIAPNSIDYVTVRWIGALKIDDTADYYFKVEADDHARFWLNGELLLDHWHEMYAGLEPSRKIHLEAGGMYELVLEYRDVRGEAHCSLLWGTEDVFLRTNDSVVPQENLYGLYELGQLSPTKVLVTSSETDASKTECHGDGLYTAQALTKSEFVVCPRDAYGNLRDDDDEVYLAFELFSAVFTQLNDQLEETASAGCPASHMNGCTHDGEGAETITPTLKYDHDIHCFRGEFTPLRAGDYQLDILFQSDSYENKVHVAGSPFEIYVKPNKVYGPYSVITAIAQPTYNIEAGQCNLFHIEARDASRNRLLTGGDNFIAYTYQVDYSSNTDNVQPIGVHNATKPNVRYSIVNDHNNGTYTVEICPVLQGTHEIHVLTGGIGVSNQPFRIMDKSNSYKYSMALGTHEGEYVHDSPYRLEVSHGTAQGFTSTAEGNGLVDAIVKVPQYIMITVRDAWSNVLVSTNHAPSCVMTLDRSPSATITVTDFNNGSYSFEYIAEVSGSNLISITVDGMHVKDSPFTVPFMDGRPHEQYSVAKGAGLTVGSMGVPSYFEVFAYDLEGNRRTTTGDQYLFEVSGANTIEGYLSECPKPPELGHPACDDYDMALGHYWGTFTPLYTGATSIDVFLNASTHQIAADVVDKQPLLNSPWAVTIFPGAPIPEETDIDGDIYDTVAGYKQTMLLKLRDAERNLLISGGHHMELVLYGVASEWGTIQPWGATPGLPNEYHYKGFYSGDQDFYGDIIDHKDGTYTITHNATIAGQYVSRYSIAKAGLNVTYFNTTQGDFGYLHDDNFNPVAERYEDKFDKQPLNLAHSISWTGDIGGRPNEGNDSTLGGKGSIGYGSYYHMFKSRMEGNVDFNLTVALASREIGYLEETKSAFAREEKFREQYWSSRFTGLITPEYAENYHFHINVDAYSEVRLYIGGRGLATNGSYNDSPQTILTVLPFMSDSSTTSKIDGWFNFTDTKPREFLLEYVHEDGESFMNLEWESPSTPKQIVPDSAFLHWANISHVNTTVHPAELSPIHSTAWGDALVNGTVGHLHSFTVYARDQYRNLRQVGNDVPSMVAVGSDGAMFRGNITDYGNSTYLVEYYATVAGQFQMYVTVGCCPAHPNIGIAGEIKEFAHLEIEGSPFRLTIQPDQINEEKSVLIGEGILGAVAGEIQTFNIMLRDLHSNPTTVNAMNMERNAEFTVDYEDIVDGSILNTNEVMETTASLIDVASLQQGGSKVLVRYNLTRAGEYRMNVYYASDTNPGTSVVKQHVAGSPYIIRVIPSKAYAPATICRGVGLRQARVDAPFSFEVQLFDRFSNHLIHGGDKIYVRLIGGAQFRQKLPIVPRCRDTVNGRHQCSYQAEYNGTHELQIQLLNASTTSPGGLGLTAKYYISANPGGLDEVISADSTVTASFEEPYYQRIESSVSGSWPDGYVIPVIDASADRKNLLSMRNETDKVVGTMADDYGAPNEGSDTDIGALRKIGQSVTWEGYLVPPRDDLYEFQLDMKRMRGSIYIDNELVYDSVEGISETVAFISNSAYHIRVEVIVVEATSWQSPVSVSLEWKTPVFKWARIPAFFLFDSANAVQFSPFPVNVGGMMTNVHFPGQNIY